MFRSQQPVLLWQATYLMAISSLVHLQLRRLVIWKWKGGKNWRKRKVKDECKLAFLLKTALFHGLVFLITINLGDSLRANFLIKDSACRCTIAVNLRLIKRFSWTRLTATNIR